MAESKKIITVFGATGAQGGNVVRSLSRTSDVAIRAVTRNPDSQKAQALAAMPGVTVVKADLTDGASLVGALEGAYGVFLVTNYWAHMSEEQEKKEIKAVLDVIESAQVEHIVWSTLDNTVGTYKPVGSLKHVPHFQCKYDMDSQFPKEKTTFFRACAYMDNFVGMMAPNKSPEGKLSLTIPMGGKKIHLTSTEHIGNVVAKAFAEPEKSKGKILVACSDKVTVTEVAAMLTEYGGTHVEPVEPPTEMYATFFPDQGSEDLANMFQFYQDGQDYNAIRDEALAGKTGDFVYPRGLPLRTWLCDNKDKIKS